MGEQMDYQDLIKEFILAIEKGDLETVSRCIEEGADVNAADKDGNTPLLKAINTLRVTRIDEWSCSGTNDSGEVTYQIRKGLFNYTTEDGETEFMELEEQREVASMWWGPEDHLKYLDAIDMIALLLENGADPNQPNKAKTYPLTLACQAGETEVVKQFLDYEARTDITDDRGATPLHRIAASGRADCMWYYIKHAKPANFNQPDDYGYTPLHYLADMGGTEKMAKLLLENGADRKIKSTKALGADTPSGMTAQQVALHWDDKAMADLLDPSRIL